MFLSFVGLVLCYKWWGLADIEHFIVLVSLFILSKSRTGPTGMHVEDVANIGCVGSYQRWIEKFEWRRRTMSINGQSSFHYATVYGLSSVKLLFKYVILIFSKTIHLEFIICHKLLWEYAMLCRTWPAWYTLQSAEERLRSMLYKLIKYSKQVFITIICDCMDLNYMDFFSKYVFLFIPLDDYKKKKLCQVILVYIEQNL